MKKVFIILLSLVLVAGVTVAIIFGVKSCNNDNNGENGSDDTQNLPVDFTTYKDEYAPTPQKTTLEENEITYDLFTNEGEELFAYANDDLGEAMDVNYNSELNGFLIKYDKKSLLSYLGQFNPNKDYQLDYVTLKSFTLSIPKDSKKYNEANGIYEEVSDANLVCKTINDGLFISNVKADGSLLINPDLNDYDTTDLKLVNYSDPALRIFIKNLVVSANNQSAPRATRIEKTFLNPDNADGYMFKFHYVKAEKLVYNIAYKNVQKGEDTITNCYSFVAYYNAFVDETKFADFSSRLLNPSQSGNKIEVDSYDVNGKVVGTGNGTIIATVTLDGKDGYDNWDTYKTTSANALVNTYICSSSVNTKGFFDDKTIAGDASAVDIDEAKALEESLPGKYW